MWRTQMSKLLFVIYFLLGFAAICSSQTVKTASLDSLIAEALRNNPRILAARDESAASRARIRQNTSFEPPQVGIEFYQTPFSSFPNPIKNGLETDYSIQQMFPYPGKRSAMGNMARYGAAMTEKNIGTLEKQVIREMKSAYYGLYLADRMLLINSQNLDLMREFIAVTARQYELGKGKQADILKAQTELSMLTLSAINFEKDKKIAVARVNTVAGRPVGDSLGAVEEIEKFYTEWLVSDLDSLALRNRPELKSMQDNINMKEAELAVSLKESMPDFMVRLMYKDMTMGKDFWSTMFGFTIPQSFWSQGKVRSKIEESRINIRKARSEYSNMRNEVFLQVHEAFEMMNANNSMIVYYRKTLIPQTEQTLQSALDGYRAGTVDFMTVIDDARMLLQVRQDTLAAIVSLMESIADLEQAVGMDSEKIIKSIQH
jgi:outer membrane protein, heavy metal efflux system